MAGPSGEKTEKPTPKRRKESRGKGQIARTQDLSAWASVLAMTFIIPMVLRAGLEQCRQMLASMTIVLDGGEGMMMHFVGDAVVRGGMVMAPLVLTIMVLSVLGHVVQIGWAPKKMKPDFKKLNVFKGIKGLFGMKLVWESIKNLVKLAIIVALALAPIRNVYLTLVTTGSGMNVPRMAGVLAEQSMVFLRTVAIAGLVLAAADYWQNRKLNDKQIKMTKQEVRDEHKQQEGDPQVKGQIRQRQMAMSRNRMMAEVPNADVIVVNPTHIAVALRYDPLVGAPVVLAKGAGPIADRIRELGGEASIPIVRDVALARTVYRLVDIGHQIPVELYEAVARVLAFVFALRARGRAAGTHDSPFADVHTTLVDLEKRRGRTPVPAP